MKKESGFSIIELIVSMVIFMIVVGTIYGLLQVGLIDRNRASRRSDILKNGRAALHIIGRDALNAGLGYNRNGAIVPDNFAASKLSLTPDTDTDRDILPAVIGGNNLFVNLLNPNAAARTDLISFTYRDTAFNGTNVISLTNAGPSPGNPAAVRLQTQPNTAQNVNPNDLYLVESDSSQVAIVATARPSTSEIEVSPGDSLGLNQPLNGIGSNVSLLQKCTPTVTEHCTTYVASVKRLIWVAYKVRGDGTFVRMVFGNNPGAGTQVQELPIAYNVEDFQVRYILEDGTVLDDPAAGPDGLSGTDDDVPANFNLVRQITVQIRVQAGEDDEQLGRPETVTLSANFSTRNLEYDAG